MVQQLILSIQDLRCSSLISKNEFPPLLFVVRFFADKEKKTRKSLEKFSSHLETAKEEGKSKTSVVEMIRICIYIPGSSHCKLL